VLFSTTKIAQFRFKYFFKQFQLMKYIQLKQCFFCKKVEKVGVHEMDRAENHHLETAIPSFNPKDSMLAGTAS